MIAALRSFLFQRYKAILELFTTEVNVSIPNGE